MDQPVEERSKRDFVMKNDYVRVSHRSQVYEAGKLPELKTMDSG